MERGLTLITSAIIRASGFKRNPRISAYSLPTIFLLIILSNNIKPFYGTRTKVDFQMLINAYLIRTYQFNKNLIKS